MNKQDLRQKYKTLRNQLCTETIDEKSLAIANNLLKMDIWNRNYFHIFLPITEQTEVNTEYILNILQGKDKEIIISKSDFKNIEMTHFLLTENTKIVKNNYNIPEPLNGINLPDDIIEVVFVPLLAFDKIGNRVGYGKGFYDKFLSKCKPSTLKIGLSFFEAEPLIEGVFDTDIKLNHCVTPNEIYCF